MKYPKVILDLETIYAEYLKTGSVHRAAKAFGTTGETIRQHLKQAGKKLNRSKWTKVDIENLKWAYASPSGFNINDLAKSLGRTHAAIACKADSLGICSPRGQHIRTPEAIQNTSIAQKEVSARTGVVEERARIVKLHHQTHGHPKGMLGKSHSEEAKAAISQFHKGKTVPRERTIRQMKTRIARYGTLVPATKRGTWKAAWCEVGGKRFYSRSRWEANYARYLEFLKLANEIVDWEHEPKTFWFDKIKRGVCSYLPDFRVVLKSSGEEYHEVKGWMDPRSKTKIKRMAKYYPLTILIVRDSPWFKKNSPLLKGIVPGWES